MLIYFTCPNCKTPMEIDSTSCGSVIECPTCNSSVTVPEKKIGPGITVGGFKIERLLGEGGMGQVWLAKQLSMDRQVALKILPSTLEHRKELKDRFLNEVRISARLQHPNIVSAHEAGEDAGVLFLAMEYVKGITLDERLRRDKILPEKESLEITLKVAAALDYAWTEHKILHRDIKPSNVMLDKNGDPKVMDMGLSKRLDAHEGLTLSGDIMGTPNYMSPEQAEGKSDLDSRSDMYSLGLTLYHMVTGAMPYAGSSLMETLRKQVNESLPDPRELNPAVTDACTELLVVMTAHDRSLRPSSWPNLLKDIDTARSGSWTSNPLAAGTSTILHMHRDKGVVKGVKVRPSVKAASSVPAWAPVSPPVELTKPNKPAWLIPAVAAGVVVIVAVLWFALRPKADTAKSPAATPAATAAASAFATNPLAGLSNRFVAALQCAQSQSNDFNEVIEAFEVIRKDGAGTEYASKARSEIEKLQSARQAALERVLNEVKTQSNALSEAGKPDEAVAMLLAYAGPLANETVKSREALASGIKRKADEQKQAADDKKKREEDNQARMANARPKLNELINQTVADLVKEDAAGALRRLIVATTNPDFEPVTNDIAFLTAQARAASEMDKRIADSFAVDTDKDVSVEFKITTNTVRIVGIDGTEIKAKRQVNGIQTEVKFSIDKLSVAEKCRRLKGDDVELALLRGLAAMEGGKVEQAEAQFGKITETAKAEIKPSAAVYVTALIDAMHKAESGRQEEEAQKTLETILTQIGIPGPYADVGAVAERVSTRTYIVRQIEPIHKAIADWNGKYGQTGYGKTMLPVTDGLAAVQAGKTAAPSTTARVSAAGAAAKSKAPPLTSTAQAARKKLDALLKLAKVDPAITDNDALAEAIEKQEYTKDEAAKLLAAYEEFDKQFREIGVAQDYDMALYSIWLASQPPVELKKATAAGLDELKAALKKEFPKFVVDERFKSKIDGDMYTVYIITGNEKKTGSLQCLAGQPIRKLTIWGEFDGDLKWLRGLPIEDLSVGSTIDKPSSLDIICTLPIRRLVIAGLHTLKPLARMRKLTDLGLGWAGVAGYGAIQRMRDIAPLRNLPLQTLGLHGFLELDDLSAISEMQELTSLGFAISIQSSVSGKLKTLPDMARLTKLTSLEITRTSLTNLVPISDCRNLVSLNIFGNPVTELKPLSTLSDTLTSLVIQGCEKITDLEMLPDYFPNLIFLRIDDKQPRAAWIGKLPKTKGLLVGKKTTDDNVYNGLPTADALIRLDPKGAKKLGLSSATNAPVAKGAATPAGQKK